MSSEADKLEKIFYYSTNNSCGFFSRVKQIPGLKSSEFENNIVMDKARYIFIKSFEEVFTNDTKILAYERGTSQGNSRSSWKIKHTPHPCEHNLTIEDKLFRKKFSNYSTREDRFGVKKRIKKLGDQVRCYKHKPETPGEKSCCGPHFMDRCHEHDGHNCCGMTEKARVDHYGVRVGKNEVLKGSLCSHKDDKLLNKELLKAWI